MKNNEHASRRSFMKQGSLALAGITIVPRHVLGGRGFTAPSDKLNIAGVGVGGKGWTDVLGAWNKGSENIVALCDVDDNMAKQAFEKWPKAKRYKDFRTMLDNEKGIDAVTVSTPDHTHAVVSMAAMQRGKHVYVQKPLAHNLAEVRQMTEAARKYKVVTQMGNQGASGDGVRLFQEWYNAGLIGEVTRVHVWTNRPVWPQGIATPTGKPPVPKELDWDLWLGPAAYRDYNPAYHPFNWRGWWDFGTGALGDMGCHMMDPPYRALGLGYPSEVECSVTAAWEGFFKQAFYTDSCPASSVVHLTFPRPGKPDVKMTWYDGGILPERPDEVPPNVELGDNGVMMMGAKGVMMCEVYGQNPRLFPETLRAGTSKVAQTLARVPGADQSGHYTQWLEACKAGFGKKPLSSSFDYAGPMTETVIMGNLAIHSAMLRVATADGKGTTFPGRKKLLWDGTNMKITNFDAANQFVSRPYRSGWKV